MQRALPARNVPFSYHGMSHPVPSLFSYHQRRPGGNLQSFAGTPSSVGGSECSGEDGVKRNYNSPATSNDVLNNDSSNCATTPPKTQPPSQTTAPFSWSAGRGKVLQQLLEQGSTPGVGRNHSLLAQGSCARVGEHHSLTTQGSLGQNNSQLVQSSSSVDQNLSPLAHSSTGAGTKQQGSTPGVGKNHYLSQNSNQTSNICTLRTKLPMIAQFEDFAKVAGGTEDNFDLNPHVNLTLEDDKLMVNHSCELEDPAKTEYLTEKSSPGCDNQTIPLQVEIHPPLSQSSEKSLEPPKFDSKISQKPRKIEKVSPTRENPASPVEIQPPLSGSTTPAQSVETPKVESKLSQKPRKISLAIQFKGVCPPTPKPAATEKATPTILMKPGDFETGSSIITSPQENLDIPRYQCDTMVCGDESTHLLDDQEDEVLTQESVDIDDPLFRCTGTYGAGYYSSGEEETNSLEGGGATGSVNEVYIGKQNGEGRVREIEEKQEVKKEEEEEEVKGEIKEEEHESTEEEKGEEMKEEGVREELSTTEIEMSLSNHRRHIQNNRSEMDRLHKRIQESKLALSAELAEQCALEDEYTFNYTITTQRESEMIRLLNFQHQFHLQSLANNRFLDTVESLKSSAEREKLTSTEVRAEVEALETERQLKLLKKEALLLQAKSEAMLT